MTLAKTSSELNFHADADHVVVTHCGRTCCKGRKINLSHVFAGQKVGVKLAMPRCADGRTSRTRGARGRKSSNLLLRATSTTIAMSNDALRRRFGNAPNLRNPVARAAVVSRARADRTPGTGSSATSC